MKFSDPETSITPFTHYFTRAPLHHSIQRPWFITNRFMGFFVTIWISVVMYRSNDIVRKQTALKGDRKISFLVGIAVAFMLHVVGVYWWYRNDDLLYPLAMLPPKAIPPFWLHHFGK